MLVVENGVVGVGLDRLPFSICAAYSEKVVGALRGEVWMWIGACGLPVKLYGIVLRMSCAQKNERKFKQRQPHRLPIREKVDWDKTLRPKYIKARSLSREGLCHRDNHLFGVKTGDSQSTILLSNLKPLGHPEHTRFRDGVLLALQLLHNIGWWGLILGAICSFVIALLVVLLVPK